MRSRICSDRSGDETGLGKLSRGLFVPVLFWQVMAYWKVALSGESVKGGNHHAQSGMDSGWRFPDETLYSQPVLCVVALAFTVDPGKEGLIVGAGAIGFGKQASA
uniref:Uncharacterized protein n=1 Tax=Candidatus Kentrum sp. DK TaxID=2126562 RepID=A0A450RTL6_9GAMM|nr:MAG: hypothetical protein BECKDK2373B_GA0170837_100151 [Candidatus Kentron sp. DK]